MRRSLLSVMVLLAVVPPAAAQQGAKSPHARGSAPVIVAQATGELTAMNLRRITVGRLTCALGAPVPALARFVLTDPVAITCKAGKLRTIKYAPLPPSTSKNGSVLSATKSPTYSGGSSFSASVNSISTIAPSTSIPGTTLSARGPIVALDSQGITVGDVTCPFGFGGSALSLLMSKLHVGDVVSLSCTLRTGGPNTMYVVWSAPGPTTGG